MRRRVMVAGTALVAVAATGLAGAGATASGGSRVVMRNPDVANLASASFNVVGCASVFGRSGQAPTRGVGVAPGGPAASLGLTAAPGDAVGPVTYVSSLAGSTPTGMSVYAEQAMTGVGYVGYQAPSDAGSSRMWIGRVELPVSGGSWQSVDLAGKAFTWTQYDMGTQLSISGPVAAADVATFTGSRGGDGYGFYALGFGCEGRQFTTDDWKVGATTYDFEGYAATVSGGADTTIAAGEALTLTANASTDAGIAPRVVLEFKAADGDWKPVDQTPRFGPRVSVTVRPDEDTTYRWKIYSTPMVEGAETAPFTVSVDATRPQADPEASTAPDRKPAKPRATPSAKAPESAPVQQAPAAPATTEPAAPALAPVPAQTEAPAPVETPAPTPTAPAETEAPAQTQVETPAPTETPAG